MTSERIAQLLADPNKIKEEPLEVFERLVIAYPYSQSIQLLYAKKLESLGKNNDSKSPSWEVYFPDKQHLYSLLKEEQNVSFQNEVDRIDNEIEDIFSEINPGKPQIEEGNQDIEIPEPLDKLSEVDYSAPNSEDVAREIIEHDNPISFEQESEQTYKEEIKFIPVKKAKKKKSKKNTVDSSQSKKKNQKKKTNENKDSTSNKTKELVTKKSTKKKTTKEQKRKKEIIPALPDRSTTTSEDPFVLWLASLKKKEQNIMASKDNKKKDKKSKKSKKAKEIKVSKPSKSKAKKKDKKVKKDKNKAKKSSKDKAEKKQLKLQSKIDSSINRKKEVVSPTLADLLAKQGHKKEAIKIYKQLMLNYPEKNSYFAAQIKKLK